MNNWYLLAAIPVFGLLVIVHEFGHFITAKWSGMRVEEFALGFPPRIFGVRKRDQGGWEVIWFNGRSEEDETYGAEHKAGNNAVMTTLGTSGGRLDSSAAASDHTIYSLNLLPIGGFVRMTGETGEVTDEYGNFDPKSFNAKPARNRLMVMVAGVVMNFILAMVLFTIAYTAGEPVFAPVIKSVSPGSPAAIAGLKSGDRILTVDNQPVQQFSDLIDRVTQLIIADKKQHSTVAITLQVQHAGQQQPFTTVVNARENPPKGQGAMGVVRTDQVNFVRYSIWDAPVQGIKHTFDVTQQFIQGIVQMVTGQVPVQVAGPVGIVSITGQTAQSLPIYGWFPLLSLTAILSLNLAIVNILPFPALDGGRIVLVFIELLRGGKRLKPEHEGMINLVGMALLLTLMVIITFGDITRWITGG
ncbi:MAG TPA: M50 family metallopeptidase [Ktedonobacteraceae bacterium]|nr:M50 family metallopeptidase [Ktedonobacteraceae bacterium]